MKITKRLLPTTILAVLGALVAAAVPTAQAANDIVVQSNQAVRTFKRTDPSMRKFFNSSVGYAILPSVTTGGLGIGIYPKGQFVHIDVRPLPSYRWVDFSPPNPNASEKRPPRDWKRKKLQS